MYANYFLLNASIIFNLIKKSEIVCNFIDCYFLYNEQMFKISEFSLPKENLSHLNNNSFWL